MSALAENSGHDLFINMRSENSTLTGAWSSG